MIWIARFAVLLAVLTTLWFNGSYAFGKANTLPHQAGLVAAAITIDLAKCSFLTVAALLWADRFRLRALILLAIWPWLFLFSTFCGYAAINTNRSETAAAADGQAQDRARTQTRYQQTLDNIRIAQASPLWAATAACTAAKFDQQRRYCDNIKSLQQTLDTTSNEIGPSPVIAADPELATLNTVLGVPAPWLSFVVSVLPAILIELAASLGSYAVGPKPHREPASTSLRKPLRVRLGIATRRFKTAPETVSAALATKQTDQETNAPPLKNAPVITWQIGKAV